MSTEKIDSINHREVPSPKPQEGTEKNGDFKTPELTPQITEIIGENQNNSQKGDSQDDNQQTGTKTPTFRDTIMNLLLRNSISREVNFPPLEQQQIRVQKAISKKIDQLLKKASKIEKSKHHSLALFESTIAEIRYLRKLLSGLFHMTLSQVESLYKRFILNK